MTTERLYYKEPELDSFTARVVSCRKTERGWEAVLDRTAFYPEGGGQPCDFGTLGVSGVTAVFERGDEVVHLITEPLAEGSEVVGKIDSLRRRDYTEQHTADHILSGIIHNRYGYVNVGFHMGADVTTIDFSGWLEPTQLAEVEDEANAVIRANLPILQSWPDAGELKNLEYRSKKELTGSVRLITIPDVDVCACCGTHLKSTGELGILKVISAVRLRGGLRVELLAGARAWRYLASVFDENRKNSQSLSAKPLETSGAVSRILEEQSNLKQELAATRRRWLESAKRENAGRGDVLIFEPGLSPEELQSLTDAVMESCGGFCAAFSGSDSEGFRYAVGEKDGNLRELVKTMNSALNGRGGGRPNFAQGQVNSGLKEIRQFFDELMENHRVD